MSVTLVLCCVALIVGCGADRSTRTVPDATQALHSPTPSDLAYDCDGDGVEDFLLGSPQWPSEIRCGKVVIYSGSSLEPIFEIAGDCSSPGFGLEATLVRDCDGDQLADVVVRSPGDVGTAALYAGSPPSKFREVSCGWNPFVGGIADGRVPEPSLWVAIRRTSDVCGILQALPLTADLVRPLPPTQQDIDDPVRLRSLSEMSDVRDGRVASEHLVRIHAPNPSKQVGCVVAVRGGPQGLSIAYGTPRGMGPLIPINADGSVLSPGCGLSSRLFRKQPKGDAATLLCGVYARDGGQDAINRILVIDVQKSRVLRVLTTHHGFSEFGRALGACVDADGVLHSFVVGAPASDASMGKIYFFSGLDARHPLLTLSPSVLTGRFGTQIVELSDINHDGISDVAIVGEAHDGEMGFEAISGKDGARLKVWAPGKR